MARPRPSILGLVLLAASALAGGCGKRGPAPEPPPPPVVTVAKPVVYPVQTYYEYNGYLDSVETVQIRARVKGVLQKVHFNEKEGGDILAGADLYTIDPREYEAAVLKAEAEMAKADADAASAEVQIKTAASDVERLTNAVGSVSGPEMNAAKAKLASNQALKKTAEANRKSAEANRKSAELDVEYTHIKAPIAGRISRTLVTKGNLVGQNETTLLTTIVRMDKLYVYFDAPERDLVERLRAAKAGGGPTSVPLELAVATETGFPHPGVIDFRENRVDPGTGTIRVRGRLDNPVGPDGKEWQLYPGLFSRIRVPAGDPRNLPVIPEDAIMTGQEGKYVYVVGPEGVVQKRTITVVAGPPVWRAAPAGPGVPPGWSMANPKPAEGAPATAPLRSVVAVESGLTENDVVVVVGLQKARPGAPVVPETWTLRAAAK